MCETYHIGCQDLEGIAMMDVELIDVTKIYHLGKKEVRALRSISTTIRAGTFMSIMGPSGSGKTTLLNIIGALDRPTNGYVRVGGRDISSFSDRSLSKLRLREYGFIFQGFYLLQNLTALENVMVPMREAGRSRWDAMKRGKELLGDVGLRNRFGHLPSQLSGGEQQRVSIARSMANDPSMILADEPTGELDSETSQNIIHILRDLNKNGGKTMIVVTHDSEIARRASIRLRLNDGRVSG